MSSSRDPQLVGERTLDVVRHELHRLCCRKRSRTAEWSPSRPSDWRPTSVTDPRSRDREPFTQDGAWNFIAELLEGGHEIQQIVLKMPAGKPGYVLLVEGHGSESIYIKLEMGSGVVIGRSFHYSYPSGEDNTP